MTLILLQKLEDIPPRGTKFEIMFTKEGNLKQELKELEKILRTYLRYKDITISISPRDGRVSNLASATRLGLKGHS